MQHEQKLLEVVFPPGTFEWFDLTAGTADEQNIYFTLVEKDIPPTDQRITARKFHDITITDFPIRGKRTLLTFRRRYWKVAGQKTLLKRDIPLVFPGTQLETEEEPSSLASIAKCQRLPVKEFEKQYKEHLSDFHQWAQKDHAEDWILYAENIGTHLSIDEVAISKGELYTIVTNKAAHGGKGALVTMVAGTKAADVVEVLKQIPLEQRNTVTEVTLDMSNAMDAMVRASFPKTEIVTDRFHVQQLVSEAVQDIRNQLRRVALKEETAAILLARKEKRVYQPTLHANGDTTKQLLSRSFYVLFKSSTHWTERQKERAQILFTTFPELQHAYHLAMLFRSGYERSQTKEEAKICLDQWYAKVNEEQIEPFIVVAESIKMHEDTILNYFINRSTNASAESFNAKLKGFRALVRGVRDIPFFLFRVGKIYG